VADWQLHDSDDFLTKHKQMYWDWCRFSGKTEKGSLMAVFLTLLGYDAHWFAKATNQFMRVQKLWNFNPFVEFHKANRQRKEVELVSGDNITMEVLLTEENCSGPHPKCIVYDEYALMDLPLIAKANLMLGENPWILYISTPVLGSPTTTLRQQVETRTHTFLDCKWKNPVEMEKLKVNGMEWMWEQEMLCKEVLPQGAVFPNVVETRTFPIQFDRICQGVDYNGYSNKNIGVRIGIAQHQIYILGEYAFPYQTGNNDLQSWALEFNTEVECGGWNDVYAPDLRGVSKKSFQEDQGQLKIQRIKALLRQLIFINPALCPHLLQDLRHAFWGVDGKVDTKELHRLAALLHAIGASPRFLEGGKQTNITKTEIRREVEGRRARTSIS
jgi:hypothetical protein